MVQISLWDRIKCAITWTILVIPGIIIISPFATILYLRTLFRLRSLHVGDCVCTGVDFVSEFVILSASHKTMHFDLAWVNEGKITNISVNMTPVKMISDYRWILQLKIKRLRWTNFINNYLLKCKTSNKTSLTRSYYINDDQTWYICKSLTFIVSKRFDIPARIIQRAWHTHIINKRKAAVQLIEDAALHYLYCPNMKNKRYNKLREHFTNMQSETISGICTGSHLIQNR